VRSGDSRGFVLVVVLWILVAVGVASVAFQRAARTSRLGSINAGAETRARWAAREGLARALDAVERFGMAGGSWDAAGLGRTIRLAPFDGGGVMEIEVLMLDARARLDLNHATPEEIEGLLAAVLDPSDPRVPQLRDRILDWRDPDDRRRPFGAEAVDYFRLDSPVRPRNGPFASPEELGEIDGIDGDLLRALELLFTVDGDGSINVNAAPTPVLSAVLGVSPSIADLVAQRARERPFSNIYQIVGVIPPSAQEAMAPRMRELQMRLAFNPQDLEVHVVASVPRTGVAARIDAKVRLVRAGSWELEKVIES